MSIFHEASVTLSERTPIFGLQLWVVIVIILGALSVLCLVLLCLCVICHRRRHNHHRQQQRQTKKIPEPDVPPVSKKNQETVHHPPPAPEIQVDIGKIDHRGVFSDRPLSGEGGGTGSLREAPSFVSERVGPEVSHLGWGRWFTLRELEAATNGLCEEHVIGEGSYGIVYWGILSDGTKVAIKNLLNNRGQAEKEFKDEVEAIGRVRHKNLVRLLGYCVEGAYRMLVYEYVDNGNLDEWLYGDVGEVSPLTWEIRMKIILGTAKGLAYLHEGLEPKVVHRDVKSSNILLDRQWNAMISDFGLAKLLCSDRSHVTTRVMGTCGYVAPEYLCTGMLTEKSDVYSFGILIMEIITGRTPVDYSRPEGEVKLVDWLKTMVGNRKSEAVIDPKLPDMPSSKALKRVLLVALRCVDPEARKRPKIGHVIHMLDPDDLLPYDHRIPREPSYSSGEENRGIAIRERSSDTSEGDSSTNNHHHPTRWR